MLSLFPLGVLDPTGLLIVIAIIIVIAIGVFIGVSAANKTKKTRTANDGLEKTRCPYCGEEILVGAKKCKHCGEWLDPNSKP